MKILILKPSSLGDVIHAIPVLRMLKRAHPAAQIYWWIASELAPLLENDPDLTGLFLFDRREAANPFFWPELISQVAKMRSLRFDYVLDLQSLARSAIVAWLANGATIVGLDDPREGAPTFYDIAVRRPSYHTHAVDWYLETLAKMSTPVRWDFEWLPPNSAARQRVHERFPAKGRRICLVPGARWENKRWPLEYFVNLARLIATNVSDAQITIIGGKADLIAGKAIKEAAPDAVQDLTGRTTLPEMVEVLRQSSLVITNDTGPMHIAAALNLSVISLFGPTEPTRTGPYRQTQFIFQESLPCVPCMEPVCRNPVHLACLTSISPERVFAEVARRLRAAHSLNNPAAPRVDSAVAQAAAAR